MDLADQGPVVPGHQVKVLVPADQVAERTGFHHDLNGMEVAPLVDLTQAGLELGAPQHEVVVRVEHVPRGLVDLDRIRLDLEVELIKGTARRPDTPLDVRDFLGKRVDLAAQIIILTCQLLLLAANLVQPILAVPDLVPDRALGREIAGATDHQGRREDGQAPQPRHPRRTISRHSADAAPAEPPDRRRAFRGLRRRSNRPWSTGREATRA